MIKATKGMVTINGIDSLFESEPKEPETDDSELDWLIDKMLDVLERRAK